MRIPKVITNLLGAISQEESRFTLGAVLFNGKVAVATDGHQLTVMRFKAGTEEQPKLIGIEALNAVKKLAPKRPKQGEAQDIDIEFSDATDCVRLLDQNGTVHAQQNCKHVAGNFPDYERVLPKELPFEYCFNAKLLIRVLDVMVKAADDKHTPTSVKLKLGHRDSAIKIEFNGTEFDIEAAVMPLREGDSNDPAEIEKSRISKALLEAGMAIRAGKTLAPAETPNLTTV